MLDPAGWTLGQVSATVRDFSVIAFLLVTVWKARGAYESVSSFFDRVNIHMDKMETFADTLSDNHLKHIEQYLKNLSHRQVRASDEEQAEYLVTDETGTDVEL